MTCKNKFYVLHYTIGTLKPIYDICIFKNDKFVIHFWRCVHCQLALDLCMRDTSESMYQRIDRVVGLEFKFLNFNVIAMLSPKYQRKEEVQNWIYLWLTEYDFTRYLHWHLLTLHNLVLDVYNLPLDHIDQVVECMVCLPTSDFLEQSLL